MEKEYFLAKVKAFFITLTEEKRLWNALLCSVGFLSVSLLFPFYGVFVFIPALLVFWLGWHNPIVGTIS
ncbi:MAG: hypothetical protein QXI58_04960, partial [Candidatus Micrarchaeia archaeon]